MIHRFEALIRWIVKKQGIGAHGLCSLLFIFQQSAIFISALFHRSNFYAMVKDKAQAMKKGTVACLPTPTQSLGDTQKK